MHLADLYALELAANRMHMRFQKGQGARLILRWSAGEEVSQGSPGLLLLFLLLLLLRLQNHEKTSEKHSTRETALRWFCFREFQGAMGKANRRTRRRPEGLRCGPQGFL